MQTFGHKGRLEDFRMLTGRGRYVSDWNLPGQAHGSFMRSDRPHARIALIDTATALAMPGGITQGAGDIVGKGGLDCIRLREMQARVRDSSVQTL